MEKLRFFRLLSLASVSGMAMSVAALAQTATPSPTNIANETVVVTGSRVISDIANSPTPLTVVTTQQLLATTPSNVSDALNKLPVFAGSSTQQTAGGASGNTGGDFLNLRNFGQQRTLVLLDGMRVPASNQSGSVDVSTLPQMLMSRTDVVTGGGSAVYGSDAITGVVNFILDKNFDGLKYDANAGISTYSDGMSYKVGVAAGTDLFGGRGHIEGSLQYRDADGVLSRDRAFGQAQLTAYGKGTSPATAITVLPHGRLQTLSFDGLIGCTNCTVNGQQFVQPGVIGPFFAGYVPPGQSSIGYGGDGVYTDWTSAIATTRNAESFLRFSYNLNDSTQAWAQFSATQANVFDYFFPSQTDPSRGTITYFKNNPFLTPAAQAQLGNNGLTDSTNTFTVQEWYDAKDRMRNTNSVTRNLDFSTGASGEVFGGYDWNIHYTHGESRDSVSGINNGNNQYHDAAQDAVLYNGQVTCYNDTPQAIALYGNIYPGCVPINVFGNNVTSDAAYNYWSRTTNFSLTNTMDDVAGDISGNVFELPAGPIKVALAGEMRWLDYLINSDASPTQTVNCYGLRLCGNINGVATQLLWDNNTVAAVHAAENVWEFSAEAAIPIVKDLPLIQAFNADVAGRYTNYSISGAVETWKVGLDWHVNDDVRFRGTTSVDIRAPTLNDLYAPLSQASGGYFDPLTNSNPGGVSMVSQGNPNLVPEVSRTYTAGVVLTPRWIPGLTASADFYNISLHNAIGTVSGTNTQVAALCNNTQPVGSSPFCSLYVRPFPYTNTTPANYPTAILSENLNAAFTATEGEDYEIDYAFNMSDIDETLPGGVALRALLNVQPKIDAASFPGAQITHGFGAGTTQANPKGHAALFLGYTLGDWSVDSQFRWVSDLYQNAVYGTGEVYYAQNRVPSYNQEDFTLTKRILLENGAAMSAYFSVQNAFNEQPRRAYISGSNPGFRGLVPGDDLMGRYFTIGIRGDL